MKSLVLLKPDCVQRGLVGAVLSLFEHWCKIEVIETRVMDRALCREHYAAHVEKDFYPGLEEFMQSAPLVAVILRGDVQQIRNMALEARDMFRGCEGPKNLTHSSDSVEAAAREIKLWFPNYEL